MKILFAHTAAIFPSYLGLVLLLLLLDEVLDHLLVLCGEAAPVLLHLLLRRSIKVSPPAPIFLLPTIPIIALAAIAAIPIATPIVVSAAAIVVAAVVIAAAAAIVLAFEVLFAGFVVAEIVVDGDVFAFFCLDATFQHGQLVLHKKENNVRKSSEILKKKNIPGVYCVVFK
jgi:hypothetical protein